MANVPAAIIQAPGDPSPGSTTSDRALLLGPGMFPRGERTLLDAVLDTGHPLVLDAGALRAAADRLDRLAEQRRAAILTPHEGEFVALFGEGKGGKIVRARAAAARCGAVVVYKGPDSVVAAPDGRAAIAPSAQPWLATAGTGGRLGGHRGGALCRHWRCFLAACEAVWLHGRAAELAGPD